jgi:hypothetical protein
MLGLKILYWSSQYVSCSLRLFVDGDETGILRSYSPVRSGRKEYVLYTVEY